MSVRLWGGLRVGQEMSLAQARDWALETRPLLDAKAESIISEKLARAAAEAIMEAMLSESPERIKTDEGKNGWEVGAHLHREAIEAHKKGARSSFFDVNFEASLIPIPGATLALMFGDAQLKQIAMEKLGATEWGWGDGEDKPSSVSAKEWARRKKEWQLALGKSFDLSPAEAGMSVSLLSNRFKVWWRPDPSQLEPIWGAALEARKRVAKDVAEIWLMRIASKQGLLAPKKKDGEDVMESAMSAWRRGRDLLEGEWKPKFEKISGMIEGMIPPLSEQQLMLPLVEWQKKGEQERLALSEALALEAIAPEPIASKPKRAGL